MIQPTMMYNIHIYLLNISIQQFSPQIIINSQTYHWSKHEVLVRNDHFSILLITI